MGNATIAERSWGIKHACRSHSAVSWMAVALVVNLNRANRQDNHALHSVVSMVIREWDSHAWIAAH